MNRKELLERIDNDLMAITNNGLFLFSIRTYENKFDVRVWVLNKPAEASDLYIGFQTGKLSKDSFEEQWLGFQKEIAEAILTFVDKLDDQIYDSKNSIDYNKEKITKLKGKMKSYASVSAWAKKVRVQCSKQ